MNDVANRKTKRTYLIRLLRGVKLIKSVSCHSRIQPLVLNLGWMTGRLSWMTFSKSQAVKPATVSTMMLNKEDFFAAYPANFRGVGLFAALRALEIFFGGDVSAVIPFGSNSVECMLKSWQRNHHFRMTPHIWFDPSGKSSSFRVYTDAYECLCSAEQ